MSEVHGHARRMVEHAALVVRADAAPEHKAVTKVRQRRPPLSLARGEVRTRQCRIVRAGPSAERDLQNQRRRGDEPERTQSRACMGQLHGPPAAERGEQRQRGEPAEKVRDDHDGLQQQRDGPHTE